MLGVGLLGPCPSHGLRAIEVGANVVVARSEVVEGGDLYVVVTTNTVPREHNPGQAQKHATLEELLADVTIPLVCQNISGHLVNVAILLVLVEFLGQGLRETRGIVN